MKHKYLAFFLSILIIGSILAGCSLAAHAGAAPINSKKLLETSEEIFITEELDEAYVAGLNDFAFHIFSKMEEENIFISPYSISMALSMLYNGADTDTRKQMAKMLGYDLLTDYTEDYNQVANQFMNANGKLLIDSLQKADSKVDIDIANSIWLAQNVEFAQTIDKTLLAPVRNYYNADIFQVDFTQDSTLEDVNEWVSDRTEGMIDPFMEEFHNEENLRLFLVNAIYFNGKWSLPFSPEATRRTPFYGLSATRNVDMMYMSETEYRYYSDKGMRGVEIPYGEGRLVMDVLIPEDTQNTTIGEVYGALTEEEINQFLEQLDLSKTTELGTLAIPKFEMEYGMVNLNSALQELGMKHAFDEYLADFGLIGKELFVSQVVHKAKIQVEEWGSKAAAATGIEMETTSALLEEPLRFIVDVPFIFFIRDKQTDAILFMGEMNQIN